MQRSPIAKTNLSIHQVDHWQKFSSPQYGTVVSLEHYHIVKDKGTSNYYIQDNKVKTNIAKNENATRRF